MSLFLWLSLFFFLQILPHDNVESPEKAAEVRQHLEEKYPNGQLLNDTLLVGAPSCDEAYLLCDIRDYQLINSMIPNDTFPFGPFGGLCFGAGVPHNLVWFAFQVGESGPTDIIFSMDSADCERNEGIQAGVFEGDCSGQDVWDCNARCSVFDFVLNGIMEEGAIYYLWVDGCNGDVCEFNMDFKGRSSFVCELPDPMPSPWIDKREICWHNEIELEPPLPYSFIEYDWLINGEKFSTVGDQSITIDHRFVDTLNIRLISSFFLRGMLEDLDTSFFTFVQLNAEDFAQVFGEVKYNLNRNCQYDGTETPWPYAAIEFSNAYNRVLFTTDEFGRYSACLPEGLYDNDLYLRKGNSWFRNCFIDSSLNFSSSRISEFDILLDIGNYCWSPIFQLIRPSRTSRIRCDGQKGTFEFRIVNNSKFPLPQGSVLISIDTLIEIDDVLNLNYTRLYPNIIEVFHPEIPAFSRIKDKLIVSSDCDVDDLGTKYCVFAEFQNTVPLCDADRVYSICEILRASYDPNMIEAFRVGETDEHYIENQELIDYTIHFENEGNDTAFNVKVIHEFDHDIDIQSFDFISSSHPKLAISLSEDNPRIITVYFPDIDLNYRSQNSSESKGFVRYQLAVDSLPELERFTSEAEIYFDYNPPIRTNTVFHTITTDFFTDTSIVDLCIGDVWKDYHFTNDTTFSDTTEMDGPDSLTVYIVKVYPTYETHDLDTSICRGSSFKWKGRLINSAGFHKRVFQSEHGCDSAFTAMVEYKTATQVNVDTMVHKGSFIGWVKITGDTTFSVHRMIDEECVEIIYHVTVIVTSTSGLPSNSLTLYPNPFTDEILVSLIKSSWKSSDIVIRDVTGRELYNTTLSEDLLSINTQDLKRGLYLIEIHHQDEIWIEKMIKR